MIRHNQTIDDIRAALLLHFIEDTHRKIGKNVQFRYEGDGLRLVTKRYTGIKDWTPRQVEEALRELEVTRKVKLSYRPQATHTSESHVEAFPLMEVYSRDEPEPEWRNLSLEELTKLVQTNDEFCVNVVPELWDFADWDEDEIPDLSLFSDMAQKLAGQTGITRRQLAICRMPGETGVPRLARCIQQIDQLLAKRARTNLLLTLYRVQPTHGGSIEFLITEDGLWLLEDGLPSDRHHPSPVKALEALETAGEITAVRDGQRVIVTSFTVPGSLLEGFERYRGAEIAPFE